jgi:tripartite-type tricarboxylate transporter receptor subunit TctC
LGQIIVENRPGGVIPGETAAKSAPDGYTLLGSSGTLWIGPLLQRMPFDPVQDFTPISLALRAPNILVVHSSLPVRSVQELISLARSRPGQLNYSSGGTGGIAHLVGELFKARAKVNIVRVAYKSGPAEMGDLLSGQVQLTFGTSNAVMAHVKTGKLRALAVTSAQPSALVPGLPTMTSVLPGFETGQLIGMLAPAKTPNPIIRRLNQEIVRFLNTNEAKARFFEVGVETVGSTPEEFAATIKTEMATWGKVIKDAGIRAD